MYPAPIDSYDSPASLAEALDLLATRPGDLLVLAGGQSALPLLKARELRPRGIVDLRLVTELRHIRQPQDGQLLLIGAMTRHKDLLLDSVTSSRWAALTDAAAMIGDLQVRNRGTLGGSLAQAEVAADWPAVTVCLGGEVVLVTSQDARVVSAGDFFLGPRKTVLQAGELLKEVRFPVPAESSGSAYDKYGITVNGPPVVGVAASITLDPAGICREARLVISGVPPAPARARRAEEVLLGVKPDQRRIDQAAQEAAGEIDTQDDFRASAAYRRQLIRIYASRVLARSLARARFGKGRS